MLLLVISQESMDNRIKTNRKECPPFISLFPPLEQPSRQDPWVLYLGYTLILTSFGPLIRPGMANKESGVFLFSLFICWL